MGTDVEAFLRRLAQEIRPRTDQLVDVLVERMRSALPELWKHEDLGALAREETASHVVAFLDVMEHGLDVAETEAPPDALDVARRFAKHGVPVSKLLRTYRLGHVSLLQLLQGEVTRLTSDRELTNAAATRLITMGFEYVDRASEQVVAAHQEERERRMQRQLILANEASKRIGTTLDTTRTAQELADVCTESFAGLVTVDLLESVLEDEEEDAYPSPGGWVLRRVAQQCVQEDSPDFAFASGETHIYPRGSVPGRALADGEAVLRSITATDVPSWLGECAEPGGFTGCNSMLLVPLLARGNTLGLAQFFRHRTELPFDEDDLRLAREIASTAAVYIDNARRYTRERSTALALQRSLMPQRAVEQSAVEVAARYLPCGSRAGVGGDWYDVIPLSGARVALVVGDVVGRGLHASATMGRLRTAVRAFADIDLMPDELLTHLDDVVIRLQREEKHDEGEISATCLYAVYDPVSRLCSLASAGHVPPVVVTPSAAPADASSSSPADFPEVAVGPPLGLGGLPFETAQFELPEGSLLALYTDGLVESRTRDVDAARTVLHEVLARAPGAPNEICDRVLAALLPIRPSDDVALLVARTRALAPEHVATLDLSLDPAVVAEARGFASARLADWGLEELSFTTELMVSELVTNAIRYGRDPIQLRMILESTLTCEVFDASSTAPHMRRARVLDEGGRGLLLVAQLAEHWGTRHSREGKAIWVEQPLPSVGAAARP